MSTTITHAQRPFGALLADLRAQRGWSQNALAADVGYDSSFICKLEAGKREPSRDTVGALAAVLEEDTLDTRRLFVAAGLLPPGVWVVRGDGCLALHPENTLVLDGDA
jgi:transcriptional regulator with XRE-family HTH domain